MDSPKHIAIVPAKKKSARCEDKNWRDFMFGESLAERKFMTALASGFFNRTVLSVDFKESDERLSFMDKHSVRYQLSACRGATIRMRPRLMKDDSVEVALDALDYVNAGDEDFYYLLQPTSPFLQTTTVRRAIDTVRADRAYGGCAVITVNPVFKPSGGLYAGRVHNLREHRTFFKPHVVPIPLDWRESVDIDEEYDFQIARSLME